MPVNERNQSQEYVIRDADPERDATQAAMLMAKAWWRTYADREQGLRHNLNVARNSLAFIKRIPLRKQWMERVAQQRAEGDNSEDYLVAEMSGRVVGLCLAMEATDRETGERRGTELRSLFVSNRHRGKGIGGALLDVVQDRHPEDSLYLGVVSENTSAIEFYEQHGFAMNTPAEVASATVPGSDYLEQIEMKREAPHGD